MSKTVWIIHQYASTPQNGMGGRHYYLSQELAKQGYNVYLIAASANHLLHKKVELEDDFKIEKISGFNFVWVKMKDYKNAHSKQRAINWLFFPWKIQKLTKIIPNKPDSILCSSPSPIAFLGAEKLARKFKAKLLFEVRDIWPLTLIEIGGFSPYHPFIRFMSWIEKRAYKKSDIVISNLKNAILHMKSLGMDRNKFVWIPNGISLDEISQKIPLNLKLPKGKFIVGYTGTFGTANDLYSLIDAMEILKEYKDIVLVLVGGGKDKYELEKYIENKQLDNIKFIDFIQKVQIQSMLEKLDILWIGAKKRPMYQFGVSPNKLFDYMYSGKPIVYSIESGDYKPIEEFNAGIQTEAQNPQAIADAILTLYNMSKEDRDIMGQNARKAVIQEYEYGKLAKKLAKVLFEIK